MCMRMTSLTHTCTYASTHVRMCTHTQSSMCAHVWLCASCVQVILPQGSEVRLLNFLLPLISVTLSMALGAFGGLLLGTLLLRARSPPASSVLQATTQHVAEAQQASRCVLRTVRSRWDQACAAHHQVKVGCCIWAGLLCHPCVGSACRTAFGSGAAGQQAH